ncbi:protein of unknown function [Methylacidimicrobium sp. AP8]|nr:protein of unknown function [Methylacidimicrobium sp. AP8]
MPGFFGWRPEGESRAVASWERARFERIGRLVEVENRRRNGGLSEAAIEPAGIRGKPLSVFTASASDRAAASGWAIDRKRMCGCVAASRSE